MNGYNGFDPFRGNQPQNGGYDNGFLGSQGQQGGYNSQQGYPPPQQQGYPPPQQGYYQGGNNYYGNYYGGYPQGGYAPRQQGVMYGGFRKPIVQLNNSAINYAIFLPLLAIFLENFTISIYLGVFLWVLVLIIERVAVYSDAKALVQENKLPDSMKTIAAIAPIVYVFKRNQLFSRGIGQFAAFCVTALIAIFSNGFVRSLYASPQSFIELTQQKSVYTIDLEKDTKNTDLIGDRLDSYVSAQDWSYNSFGKESTVILSGTFNSDTPEGYGDKDIKIYFKYNFDGYNIKSMDLSLDKCEVAGEELDDEELKKLCDGLFNDWDLKEDETDSSSEEKESSRADDIVDA